MKNNLCFSEADILLPKENFEKFAVIACDQFTSEPEYWEKAKKHAEGFPTALDLILPEIYLTDDNSDKISRINENMDKYLSGGVFSEVKNSFIFTKRVQSDGALRLGLIGKIDLKEYSYLDGAATAVRSTEKTVLERIPPRAQIRRGAMLELPHVLLLFDDEKDLVMNYLAENEKNFENLYGFTLFGGAGSLSGYKVDGAAADRVKCLLSEIQAQNDGLLFCVGDGNHSLAAAKRVYEQTGLEKDRYALVEIVNIHSPAINFEPIYRVVFGIDPKAIADEFINYGNNPEGSYEHSFKLVCLNGVRDIKIKSNYKLPVAALQDFLDNGKDKYHIDYIHGIDSTEKIARSSGDTIGFIFDGMGKSELFEAVIKNGSLPRKTFSMGHALDKRFYLEARRIGLPSISRLKT